MIITLRRNRFYAKSDLIKAHLVFMQTIAGTVDGNVVACRCNLPGIVVSGGRGAQAEYRVLVVHFSNSNLLLSVKALSEFVCLSILLNIILFYNNSNN